MSRPAILCVDDEKAILDSLQLELEKFIDDKYVIELTESGDEAIEVFEDLTQEGVEVVLVIADYIMPGMKGDELLTRIHQLSPKTIKIMLTGQADVLGIGKAINKANLYRYLTKPWQSDDLSLTVTEAIYRYSQEQQLEAVNRQQAQLIAQLHDSESRLRQFLDGVPVGITVFDAEGKPAYHNRTCMSILNMEAIKEGDNLENLVAKYRCYKSGGGSYSPEETPPWKALQGETITVDDMILQVDDKAIPVEAIGTPIYNQEGEVIYAIVAFQDITERKKSQELLTNYNRSLEAQIAERTKALKEAKELAEAANRAKSVFLANMSHELRTPLNIILGFTQLMERETNLSPRQQEFLSTINRSGAHLLNLINDILEMSKIEAGRAIFRPASFDLHALLQTLEEMFRIRSQAKQLHLSLQAPEDLPRYILTDEGKLRQILINLLSNAVKFTEKGSIKLRVNHRPDAAEKSLLLGFEIEDTGPGIPAEEINNIFEPFVQSQTGMKAREGTGLGLPISRQFVQLMGGKLKVSSIVGKGSTFRFVIPVKLSDDFKVINPVRKKVICLAPEQARVKILVVDDGPENRDLITQLLESVGFEVMAVNDGQEAVIAWQTWQPDLIFMDMRMPVMDGYTATREIRRLQRGHPSLSAPTIIALTASAFDEQHNQTIAAGCDDFIGKPFQEEEIFTKIELHLGVKYLYNEGETAPDKEEATEDLQPEDLRVMPPEWCQSLKDAATRVNGSLIEGLLDEIPSEYSHLAQKLRELVQQFRFDIIVELCEEL